MMYLSDNKELENLIQTYIIEPNEKKINEWWQLNIDAVKIQAKKNEKVRNAIQKTMLNLNLDQEQAITVMIAEKILNEK